MGKIESYRETLRSLDGWDEYLLANSGLPGPRGNLELAAAVAEEGSEALFCRYLTFGPDIAPTGTPDEFLAFCGTLGLGVLLAAGRSEFWPALISQASDPRWRAREAVAMALQRLGDADMTALLNATADWVSGSRFEQRAVAAGLCEPRLLKDQVCAERVLNILDHITSTLPDADDSDSDGFATLKKGLAYCWSVAVAAHPEVGQALMDKWLANADRNVAWIMRENLKKNRLAKAAPEWTARWRARLGIKG